MRIFICWSGATSKQVAEALRWWLPRVIQALDPWVSSEDIPPGSRWNEAIAAGLKDARRGIVCVTSQNGGATPWLTFEAGACANMVGQGKVSPFLWDIEASSLNYPMAQFQSTRFNEFDVRRLIFDLNDDLGEQALAQELLQDAFEKRWPDLESRLGAITRKSDETASPQPAAEHEMLAEVLMIVRHQGRRIDSLLRRDEPHVADGDALVARIRAISKSARRLASMAPLQEKGVFLATAGALLKIATALSAKSFQEFLDFS